MGEFLQVGGNPAWLQGLHCAPQKLRNLNEINKLLAHRPWLITKEHIEVRAGAQGTTPPKYMGFGVTSQGMTFLGLGGSISWRAGSVLRWVDGEGVAWGLRGVLLLRSLGFLGGYVPNSLPPPCLSWLWGVGGPSPTPLASPPRRLC